MLPVGKPGKKFVEYFVKELDVNGVGEADFFLDSLDVLISDDEGYLMSSFDGSWRVGSTAGRRTSFNFFGYFAHFFSTGLR